MTKENDMEVAKDLAKVQNYKQLSELLSEYGKHPYMEQQQKEFDADMQKLLGAIEDLIFDAAGENAKKLITMYGATINALINLFIDIPEAKGLPLHVKGALAVMVNHGLMILKHELKEAEQKNNRNLV